MTQVQEIAQFNRMLDITLGIGEPGEAAQQEQGQDIQRLLQLATVLAADDFRDELRPAQAWRRQADRRARAASTPRWVLPHRRAAFLVMAVLALMLAALLAVGPERALAALRGLLGYLPGIGLVDARDHVEEGRLPAPVRADQADELSFLDLGAQLVDRTDPAEVLSHAVEA